MPEFYYQGTAADAANLIQPDSKTAWNINGAVLNDWADTLTATNAYSSLGTASFIGADATSGKGTKPVTAPTMTNNVVEDQTRYRI